MGASVSEVVQAILFALFASLTGILWAVTLPTYNDLLVPELLPGAAYPPLFGPGSGASSSFLTLAAQFSGYLVANVVDPAVGGVVVGVDHAVARHADRLHGPEEGVVVGHGFFHELFEQKKFGAVDDGVDAVLEGFHRRDEREFGIMKTQPAQGVHGRRADEDPQFATERQADDECHAHAAQSFQDARTQFFQVFEKRHPQHPALFVAAIGIRWGRRRRRSTA